MPLVDLKSELESVAAVEIRIANPALGRHPVTARVAGESGAKAFDVLLRDFNYAQFADPRSGRVVYLLTSLADSRSSGGVAEAISAAAPSVQVASGSASASPPLEQPPSAVTGPESVRVPLAMRSLDQAHPIAPPRFDAYAAQRNVMFEMERVREETLARAHSILVDPANGPAFQQQALNDLVGLGDPRSLPVLQQVLGDRHVLEAPQAAVAIARAAWHYAAQQQFAGQDTARLLQTMANSADPQIRSIGEAALRDAGNFLGANKRH